MLQDSLVTLKIVMADEFFFFFLEFKFVLKFKKIPESVCDSYGVCTACLRGWVTTYSGSHLDNTHALH